MIHLDGLVPHRRSGLLGGVRILVRRDCANNIIESACRLGTRGGLTPEPSRLLEPPGDIRIFFVHTVND